jgi:glycosyltransferase involved in cell wall biosynthesis
MARGCPVLASDIAAVREVAGDGALLVSLDAESAWVDAVRALARDDELRSRLRARGDKVVSRYSWERTARGLCELFLELRSA